MAAEPRRADSHRTANLIEKFQNRKYRHSYVAAHTRRFLARQMRKFRGEKSQTEFGEAIDKQQTVVSRLEDPAYGKMTLQTLLDVAEKLDVALFVRFVDHYTFVKLTDDLSDEAAVPQPFDKIEASRREQLSSGEAARAYDEALKSALQQRPPRKHETEKLQQKPQPELAFV